VIQGRSLAGGQGSGQRAASSLRGLADRGGSWGNGGVLAAGKAGPRPLTTAETTQSAAADLQCQRMNHCTVTLLAFHHTEQP
jgi:hypothetical protein